MSIQRNSDGVIINAEELTVDDVVHERVLCPACGSMVFKSWPKGWDGHSAYPCQGLESTDPEDRKEQFKSRFEHLFR